MNKRDEPIFKHLMQQYKIQYDLNGYNRDNYDENLEYYLSYRNSQEYPLAFNESFNKILPIIYTILSRFMDQMYQTSNVVSVKPRKNKDIQNAKSVEAVLNYQLESLNSIDNQGGSYLTMMKWFFNALTFGKGIIKCYWKKEERISPKRVVLPIPEFDRTGRLVGMKPYDHLTQEMQIAYDGPYAEVLHNKLFVPHPNYRSIAQMPAVFLVYSRSIDYIKKLANKGVYKNLKELGFGSTGGAGHHPTDSTEAYIKSLGIEGGLEIEDINSEHTTHEVDIIEAYTKLILKDNPYEIGSGIKIKGLEEEAIVHIGNYKTILSIQRNTYGVRPLFDIGCYMHPEMYWDVGLVRLTKGIQKQIDNMANLRMQNAFMQINQMIRVDPDSDVDPASLVWRPFGIVPAHEGEVEALAIPDYNSNIFAEQMSFFDSSIQDLTGMYCLLTEGKDTDYEILTEEGWKTFDSLNQAERVMTLDYENEIMEWQKPTEYIEYKEQEYDCYHFKNQNAEFICSPEHRIPLIGNGKKKVQMIKDIPESSYQTWSIPMAGFKWKGDDDWEAPFGATKEDWCAFMGIWLAEGHTQYNNQNGSYQIGIAQDKEKNPHSSAAIEALLGKMTFNFRYNGRQFIKYNKSLCEYLVPFGKSHEKYIPETIKNSSPELLRRFLDWYLMGDGCYLRGQWRFSTVSERLADDIQEICLKLGYRATFREDNNSELGKNYHNRWSGEITLTRRSTGLNGSKTNDVITKAKYKGRMTCLKVPNGIFLIRKNKKHIWTGNSYNMGQTPQRQERVGVVYSLQAMGEARAKLMLMSMDYLGIRPLLKHMMLLNTFHLPSGFEFRVSDGPGQQFNQIFGQDIHSDFDFAARYTAMEPALGKQARGQQLVQMAPLMQQNPWINQYQWTKTLLELADVRETEQLLKQPQQFQQEMQQQQKAAMMEKQLDEKLEGDKKIRISEKDFQESLIENEQLHGHNLALAALEGELANEKSAE